jgi:RAT1-interacting protein
MVTEADPLLALQDKIIPLSNVLYKTYFLVFFFMSQLFCMPQFCLLKINSLEVLIPLPGNFEIDSSYSFSFSFSQFNSNYYSLSAQTFAVLQTESTQIMSAFEFSLDERSPNAALKQPSEISSYSLDAQRQIHIDSTQELRYFYFPETLLPECYDLNQGHASWIKKVVPEGGAHLDEMLSALVHYEREINNGKKVKGDFVTYRGVMTKLLTLPFDHESEDIDINVMAFDGQIFMELDHELLEAKRAERELEQQKQQQKQQGGNNHVDMSYWGYKFEALATLPRPWGQCTREEIEARPRAPVDSNPEYCVLVTTGVGKTRVLLGAEVDAVQDYKPATRADYKTDRPLNHYVELKTTRVVDSVRSARAFERKLLRTWAQSFLIGVPRVVYAFRDGTGIIRSLQEFRTAEIPKLVHSSTVSGGSNAPAWNGNECVAFYAAVLEWIKATVLADTEKARTPWRLQFLRGGRALSLYKLKGPEADKVQTKLLLPEFVEWRQLRSQQKKA